MRAGTSACVVISMVSTLTVRRQWPDQLVLAVLVAFVPDSYISLNVHAGVLRLAGTLIGIAVLEPFSRDFTPSSQRAIKPETAFRERDGAALDGRSG